MQNEFSFCMQRNYFAWLLDRASNHAGLGRTIWVRPGPQNHFGSISAHCFLGLCLAQSAGPAQPICFNNIYLIYIILYYIFL
jgi:hypothetical protein